MACVLCWQSARTARACAFTCTHTVRSCVLAESPYKQGTYSFTHTEDQEPKNPGHSSGCLQARAYHAAHAHTGIQDIHWHAHVRTHTLTHTHSPHTFSTWQPMQLSGGRLVLRTMQPHTWLPSGAALPACGVSEALLSGSDAPPAPPPAPARAPSCPALEALRIPGESALGLALSPHSLPLLERSPLVLVLRVPVVPSSGPVQGWGKRGGCIEEGCTSIGWTCTRVSVRLGVWVRMFSTRCNLNHSPHSWFALSILLRTPPPLEAPFLTIKTDTDALLLNNASLFITFTPLPPLLRSLFVTTPPSTVLTLRQPALLQLKPAVPMRGRGVGEADRLFHPCAAARVASIWHERLRRGRGGAGGRGMRRAHACKQQHARPPMGMPRVWLQQARLEVEGRHHTCPGSSGNPYLERSPHCRRRRCRRRRFRSSLPRCLRSWPPAPPCHCPHQPASLPHRRLRPPVPPRPQPPSRPHPPLRALALSSSGAGWAPSARCPAPKSPQATAAGSAAAPCPDLAAAAAGGAAGPTARCRDRCPAAARVHLADLGALPRWHSLHRLLWRLRRAGTPSGTAAWVVPAGRCSPGHPPRPFVAGLLRCMPPPPGCYQTPTPPWMHDQTSRSCSGWCGRRTWHLHVLCACACECEQLCLKCARVRKCDSSMSSYAACACVCTSVYDFCVHVCKNAEACAQAFSTHLVRGGGHAGLMCASAYPACIARMFASCLHLCIACILACLHLACTFASLAYLHACILLAPLHRLHTCTICAPSTSALCALAALAL